MVELPRLDDAWILAQRGPRNEVDPARPYEYLVEAELSPQGALEDVGTIFITNRECPFRCLMCDLWKNTTTTRVSAGAVAGQIAWALSRLPPVRHVKLYNAGSFFDKQAIPRQDWAEIEAEQALVAANRELITRFEQKIQTTRARIWGENKE